MKKRELSISELKNINGGWSIPLAWKVVSNGWNHRKDIMSGISDGIKMGSK